MSNNFRKTAFLKKKMTCKLKLQNKGLCLKNFGAYLCLASIFHTFVFNFFRDFLTDKCTENFKKVALGRLAHVIPSIFFLLESLEVKHV